MDQLTISNLDKTYDGKTLVLKGINVTVEKGEFVVLVGPSGCGKSTLLRCIAGLEEVTSGKIIIGDREVNNLPPAKRDIAMVFQDYALYPHMTVEKNLSFGLKMRKIPEEKVQKEVQMAASMLGIEALLNRKPASLSGGQRQRVAIGRAIVRHAALFLFDEPLSNLDAKLRSQTRIELASLHDKIGATSIYVTHDQVEAMTLADKIVVLHEGVVQQIGSPMQLYIEPANKFVGSFIGNPSMNFIDGTLDIDAKGKSFNFMGIKLDFTDAPTPKVPGPYSLGVRPESLKVLAQSGRESEGIHDFDLKVLLKEPHGHEVHVIGEIKEQQLLIRCANPNRLKVIDQTSKSQQLKVTIDRTALHWFSQQSSGERIKELSSS